MATKISENVNTTETVFKDSKKKDAELATETLKENARLKKEKLVKFKCDIAYSALYPNGFESMVQGFNVRIAFDGSEIELPEFIADFVTKKVQKKALSLANKQARNANKTQDYLGMNQGF